MARLIFCLLNIIFLLSKTIEGQECNLSLSIIQNIASYQTDVDQIINLFTNGAYKGRTYNWIQDLTDKYPARLSGSSNLEGAIDYILQMAADEGFFVETEDVTAVPNWTRGDIELQLTSPRVEKLEALSLGTSVATPVGGIETEILVVESFEDLAIKQDQVAGKIVLFNYNFTSYSVGSIYRMASADAASRYGAVAVMVRSATDFSLNTPHTGVQSYIGNVPKIPAVSVTVEDANLMHRMFNEGETLRVYLSTTDVTPPDTTSRNLVIETPGAENPLEMVVVSGHIDSWDVGRGVMDDAGGVAVSYQANSALRTLGLIPSRTFRTVLFTAEEFGSIGGQAYFHAHSDDVDNFQLMMESDGGTFRPLGISFSGGFEATCMMEEIVKLLSPINADTLYSGSEVSDLGQFSSAGVPTASPKTDESKYFWYHHTNADTIDVYD